MYNPEIHKRKSIRLPGFNYESKNAYFITICTQNRNCIFGCIENGVFKANDAGKMVDKYWMKLENKFKDICLDEYIIRPNHLHGIITIVGADPCVCPNDNNMGYGKCGNVGADPCVCPNKNNMDDDKCGIEGEHTGSPLHKKCAKIIAI